MEQLASTPPSTRTTAIRPGDLSAASLLAVPEGGRLSGSRGDALVVLDRHEHSRRQRCGLGAVTDLTLLDSLLNLPLGVPVPLDALTPRERERLSRAPEGVATHSADGVRRLVTTPAEVQAVLVHGRGWDTVLRHASTFRRAAQSIAVFPAAPRQLGQRLWEAQVEGVGVWVQDGDTLIEILPPAISDPCRVKPAWWRFHEAAYAAWLTATYQPESSNDPVGRRVQRAGAASCPLQVSLPLH